MSRIEELKDRLDSKTLNFVLLSMASVGIYTILWLYRTNQILSDVTKTRIVDHTYIVWITVCMGMGGMIAAAEEFPFVVLLGGLLSIAGNVLIILWAFKARKALVDYALTEHQIYLRLNSFYTFIFSTFYINYCINDLPEEKRRQDLFRGEGKPTLDKTQA